MTNYHNRSLSELLHDLRDQTARLFRQEFELARTEASEKLARVTRNALAIAIGGFIAFLGLLFMLWGIIVLIFFGLRSTGLADWIAAWLAPFAFGLFIAVVGAAALFAAMARLRRTSLKPEKTLETLQQDTQWLKEKVT